MKTNYTNTQIARMFTRTWGPHAQTLHTMADCDSKFDGGEFSDPVSGTKFDEAYNRHIYNLATKLDIWPSDLFTIMDEYDHSSQHPMYGYFPMPYGQNQ